MAVNEIRFKDLPFQPERKQVFYIENGYDAVANDFILNNYLDLKSMFARLDMEFYYLPYLLREHDVEAKVRYYAPYLSPQLLVTKVPSNAFVPFIADSDARNNLKPSFIFDGTREEHDGDVRFMQMVLSDIDLTNPDALADLMRLMVGRHETYCSKMMMRGAMDSSEDAMPYPPSAAHFSFQEEEERIRILRQVQQEEAKKCLKKKKGRLSCLLKRCSADEDLSSDAAVNELGQERLEDDLAEEQSLIATADVLRELRMTVQRLRLEGVSLMAIHEFIDKQEPLSRMVITPDYRIFLPEYNNMEIEMGTLPKAIYFLFLRYPKGIVYKHMQDYYTELLNIYRQLRPYTDKARLNLTITKVVNPIGNALNENIARIKKAFVEKFDEHLANNYIITGERGSQYAITLDRDLITWEE